MTINAADYDVPEVGRHIYCQHRDCPESAGRTDHKPRLWINNDGNWVAYYCHHCGEKLNKLYRVSLFDNHPHVEARRLASNDSGRLPDDFTPRIPGPELQWLFKYLSPTQLKEHGVGYSASHQRIIFPVQGGYLERSVDSKPKWKTSGTLSQTIMVNQDSLLLVLVEDLVSAIKVMSAGYSVMPLYGTSLSHEGKLKILTNHGTNRVAVWLDKDATHKSDKMLKELELYIRTVQVITDKDPKEYIEKEIRRILH